MASTATIRHLHDQDAGTYAELRREALLESPLSFASSPADDLVSSPEAVRDQLRRSPESVILGAFRPGLVGTVGLYRDRHLKASHKAYLWGMYVAPGHRRQGIARELLQAALGHARALRGVSWVHLSVSSAAPEARRLYETVGFRLWGTEAEALRHGGQTVAEHHMALPLA